MIKALKYRDQQAKLIKTVKLSGFKQNETPHLIFCLDGVPFKLINKMYREKNFRLFNKPSRLLSCFPSMTDLAFSRIFKSEPPLGYEAKYFDYRKNRISNGSIIYLRGKNAKWSKRLSYRCSFFLDALAYITPEIVFNQELRNIYKLSKNMKNRLVAVYSVGTAGLGTTGGKDAILEYLKKIDLLCERIVYESDGNVTISIIADHGHTMTFAKKINLASLLKKHGYKITNRINNKRDVVIVKYGLVTFVAIYTKDAYGVSKLLYEEPAVDLLCFKHEKRIFVWNKDGKAIVERKGKRYRYITEFGDPLDLERIIKKLKYNGLVDENNFIDDIGLFQASAQHKFPDPLKRIWEAFHSIAQNPSNILISLKDKWCHGSNIFNFFTGGIKSTHGSMNHINTNTIVMSMWGELPPVLRLEDVIPAIEAAIKRQ